jgi:urease accessory protein
MLESGNLEKIEITRLESDRSRIRKVSDKGTELALTTAPGTHISDGDVVLLTSEKMVIVQRAPENVAMVSVKGDVSPDHLFETAVKLGHTIGNMHRPVRIEGKKIFFPIQAQSEIELFQKLLLNLKEHLDIKSDNMIFEPEPGYNVHEH